MIMLEERLMNYCIVDILQYPWLTGKTIENVTTFMIENKLSFIDFNDWIIAYDAFSRKVPLATFGKILYSKCKKFGIQVIENQFDELMIILIIIKHMLFGIP